MRNALFSLIICMLICCACNSNHKYLKAIAEAEAILNEFPDGAAHIIYSEMANVDELPDSIKAMFALTIAQAHKNTDKAMVDDSLVLFALDYYKERADIPNRLLQSYLLASDHLRWKNKKNEAILLANEGLGIAKSREDTGYIFNFYISLLRSVPMEEGYRYMRQMVDLYENTPRVYEIYMELGNTYTISNQADSAIYYFEKGIEQAVAAGDEIRANFTRYNYADALNLFGNPNKALAMQRQAITYFSEKHGLPVEQFATQLAGYHINMHQPDSARYYLNLFRNRSVPVSNDLLSENYSTILTAVLRYNETGIFDIYRILSKNKELIYELNKKEKERAEQLENKNRAELVNMQLMIDRQRTRTLLVIIIFVIVLAVVLLLFYLWKRKKQMIEKEEELEAFKRLLTEAGKIKEPNAKDDAFFKQVLLQQLGLIRLVAATPTTQNQELLKQMSRITNKDIEVESLLVWDDLYKVIDSIYDNFYTNLKDRYGNLLLDKEIQLCCLLKANFSTKEISVIAQQSTQTIYQRKTSIRQKLKMEEKEDIADFLSK